MEWMESKDKQGVQGTGPKTEHLSLEAIEES